MSYYLLLLGEGGDGLACVRFGMVTSDTDVGELLSLVETAGQEEEETGKVLDTMAEVVKRGSSYFFICDCMSSCVIFERMEFFSSFLV